VIGCLLFVESFGSAYWGCDAKESFEKNDEIEKDFRSGKYSRSEAQKVFTSFFYIHILLKQESYDSEKKILSGKRYIFRSR
jgi:hypothetical protein